MDNVTHAKHKIKNKTNKNYETTWNKYYFGCKDYTQNFKLATDVVKIR